MRSCPTASGGFGKGLSGWFAVVFERDRVALVPSGRKFSKMTASRANHRQRITTAVRLSPPVRPPAKRAGTNECHSSAWQKKRFAKKRPAPKIGGALGWRKRNGAASKKGKGRPGPRLANERAVGFREVSRAAAYLLRCPLPFVEVGVEVVEVPVPDLLADAGLPSSFCRQSGRDHAPLGAALLHQLHPDDRKMKGSGPYSIAARKEEHGWYVQTRRGTNRTRLRCRTTE